MQDLQVVGARKTQYRYQRALLADETFFDSPRFLFHADYVVLKAKAVPCPGVEITFKDEINNARWCYQDSLNHYLAEAVNSLQTLPENRLSIISLAILKRWTGRY